MPLIKMSLMIYTAIFIILCVSKRGDAQSVIGKRESVIEAK